MEVTFQSLQVFVRSKEKQPMGQSCGRKVRKVNRLGGGREQLTESHREVFSSSMTWHGFERLHLAAVREHSEWRQPAARTRQLHGRDEVPWPTVNNCKHVKGID